MKAHVPSNESEAAEIIRAARADKATLAIVGGETRAGLGRPVATDAVVSTRALTGITLYEPAEMVISARAGTSLREIEAALGEKSQMLPFEPTDPRALYGASGEPTIGGVVATAASGPRRVQAGAVRDHLIGARFVNGRGEIIKSGGRVMKNVTGLDLVKIHAGAMGTLGLLTEVTFKLLPAPRDAGTLVFEGLDDARAIGCLCAAMGSPFEVSGAAHLPAGVGATMARTLLRIEHFPESVAYRLDRLAETLREFGLPTRLDRAATIALWRDIGDGALLAAPRDNAIWKISVAPTCGAAVVAAIAAKREARWCFDWSGGLVWLSTSATDDGGAEVIRAAVAAAGGGHATLVRAPDDLRARVNVFQPLAPPLMKLSRDIARAIDPDGVFNPGRMYATI